MKVLFVRLKIKINFETQSTFMNNKNPLEELQAIRKMMEGSTKFLSLSGLAGIFAGTVAIAGALFAYYEILKFEKRFYFYAATGTFDQAMEGLEVKLFLIAAGILVLAIGGGVLFSYRKAKKQGQKLMTPLSLKLVYAMGLPLLIGGLFTLAVYFQGKEYFQAYYLIPPLTLVFYGMALLNASKYVHQEIKYLAVLEMVIGLIAVLDPANGLIYWIAGFGILHIIYGTIMYFKYDRKPGLSE